MTTGQKTDTVRRGARVLSVSLDSTIVTEDGWSRERQQKYAEHFEEYVVIVKTERSVGTVVEDGPLTAVPTRSRNRYAFVLDAYRLAVDRAGTTNVDVVTVQDPFVLGALGWVLKQRLGAELHTQVHIDFFDNEDWTRESLKRRLFAHLGRLVLRKSDVLRVGTTYEKSKLEDLLNGTVPVYSAPVHLDFETLAGDVPQSLLESTRREARLDDRPVVLFAGRFVPQKNLQRFVDVAEMALRRTSTEPVFLLAGDGPKHDEIVSLVKDRNLTKSFRFPGFVSEETLAAFYSLADICLLTSDFEGTCRVLVEAALNELPVVSTPFAGARDNVVDGETGYVESDTESLTDRLVELLENESKREQFGERGRKRLEERFNSERLVEEYVEFLQPREVN